MKQLFIYILTLTSVTGGFAQFDIASMPEMPESIKKGADVIKRYEEMSFEVSDIDKARESIYQVYTVLNAKGAQLVKFHEYTTKFKSIDDIDIRVYDAFGRLVSKFKKKDIYRQADMSGLVDDGYHYVHDISAPAYPFTVEIKYQVNYAGTLFYPSYYIMGVNEGVQHSTFTAKVPAELDLRFKEQKIKLTPEITQSGNYKIYKWSVKNQVPITQEENSVSPRHFYPAILLAPNRFKMYNTYGEMTSWKKFGEWKQRLYEGLDVLPEERKNFFANLVKGASNEREKVRLVYEYLQKNFRYVSIQLGIGGWKPFPAKFTDEKKYGDCKALSFYMYAVLKSIGIKSYMASINGGYDLEAVDPSFPMNGFNHVILCVPQNRDTIWLECTDQTIDFDYLSDFTENRNALLITENGGVLVSTPVSDPLKNRIMLFTDVKFDETGAGISTTKLNCSGIYRVGLNNALLDKRDKQKEYVVRRLGFKQPDEFSFEGNGAKDVLLGMTLEKIPDFNAGSKMFLKPRINKLDIPVLPATENRNQDFYFRSPFQFIDTTIYHLPEGYVYDVLPRKSTITSDFVNYSTDYWYDENKRQIYSVVNFSITKNKIPAGQYLIAKKSFDAILSDGTQKIVIKRN